jgi:RNA polymerase sigma-70 factor, ECF subfamily
MADEASRNDERIETELYARYVHVARAYFVRHGARDDEDLAHEAVLIALQALRDGRMRERERIGGFLLGVCRNLVRDRARRDARAERAFERVQASTSMSTPARLDGVDAFKLWRCVNALSARARDVVLRTWVDDDDADTIAHAHATSAGNVRVLRHRALAALLECLERREGGER